MKIEVLLGRIEQCVSNRDETLVALPANEFFDDHCIHDPNSALGAFMLHFFPDRISEIQSLVESRLAGEPASLVYKTPNREAASYGIGRCVFLDRPLSSRLRIALVSVTTQRADIGLSAEPAYIFEATASLHRLMANNRINRLLVPVLGSGHGCLDGAVALSCTLLSFGVLRRKAGHALKEARIVVFRGNEKDAPAVPETQIRQALDLAAAVLEA